jgi:hypothetical protein
MSLRCALVRLQVTQAGRSGRAAAAAAGESSGPSDPLRGSDRPREARLGAIGTHPTSGFEEKAR